MAEKPPSIHGSSASSRKAMRVALEEMLTSLATTSTILDLTEMIAELAETGNPHSAIDRALVGELYSNFMLKIGTDADQLPTLEEYILVQATAFKFGQTDELTLRRQINDFRQLSSP